MNEQSYASINCFCVRVIHSVSYFFFYVFIFFHITSIFFLSVLFFGLFR
jgi:hypothetical protein